MKVAYQIRRRRPVVSPIGTTVPAIRRRRRRPSRAHRALILVPWEAGRPAAGRRGPRRPRFYRREGGGGVAGDRADIRGGGGRWRGRGGGETDKPSAVTEIPRASRNRRGVLEALNAQMLQYNRPIER